MTTDYYSTAASLDAVSSLDPSNAAYTAGFDWLSTQIVSPTDYLARRIIALKRTGQDTTSEMEGLLLYRDFAGGRGINPGFDDSILDTALALQALKSANYSDDSVLYHAVLFLINGQNADGGWGFLPSGDSNVFVTATVLKVLPSYVNYNCSARSAVDKGVVYPLSKQNADGGFATLSAGSGQGSSPSNVYETALSIISLIESGQVGDLPLQNAINYLTSAQLPNGSWHDDPYSTALALQAPAKVKPLSSIRSILSMKRIATRLSARDEIPLLPYRG